jgi:hypothetical protein
MCIGRAGDEREGLRGAVGCVSGSPQYRGDRNRIHDVEGMVGDGLSNVDGC